MDFFQGSLNRIQIISNRAKLCSNLVVPIVGNLEERGMCFAISNTEGKYLFRNLESIGRSS